MPSADPHLPPASSHRPDVDGLRGFAIIGVVLFHFFPAVAPGGFVGVDVFFVISGFVITRHLLGTLANGSFSLLDFYARRVRRLMPALLVVLLATLLAGDDVLLPREVHSLARHTLGGLSYTSNFLLWREGGYFDRPALDKPLHHLWSLGVEEQFYLVWPLLLWAARGTSRQGKVVLLATLLVASFATNLWLTVVDPHAAFFLPFGRLWQLGVGAMAALGVASGARFANLRAWAGLTLLASALFLTSEQGYPGFAALVPTLGTFAAVTAGPEAWFNRRLLSFRPLVGLGLVSYPLYLWHWPLLVFARLTLGRANAGLGDELFLPLGARLIVLALSLGLAVLTWHFVERPIRAQRRVSVRALLLASAGLAAVAALFAGGIVAGRNAPTPLEDREAAMYHFSFPTPSLAPFPFHGQAFQRVGGAPPQVLFVGDSNMQQYAPALEARLARAPTRPFAFATRGGCPPFVAIDEPGCAEFLVAAHDLAEDPAITTVVFAAQWALYLTDPRFTLHGARLSLHNKDTVAALDEFTAWLRHLHDAHKRVLLVLNIPSAPPLDPLRSARRSWLHGARLNTDPLPREQLATELAWVTRLLADTARAAGSELIDPFDYLCDARWCPVVTPDGLPIYLDSRHLRPFYVERTFHAFDALVDVSQDNTRDLRAVTPR